MSITVNGATAANVAAMMSGNYTASNTSGSADTSGQTQVDDTYNSFIRMLLAQVKDQDPTKPVDPSQFTQQLVGLSQVQQSVNTNSNLQKLLSVMQGSQLNSAADSIGKTVEATGNQGFLVNGNAEFSYSLASAASNVTVTINDASGNAVYTGTGSGYAGNNVVTWDGSENNGSTAPDGVYQISVKATDASGGNVAATTYTTGVVSSANMNGGQVSLELDGGLGSVAMSDVAMMRNAAQTDSGSWLSSLL
jgi:flagellar basal-body rod modification protein FlgD